MGGSLCGRGGRIGGRGLLLLPSSRGAGGAAWRSARQRGSEAICFKRGMAESLKRTVWIGSGAGAAWRSFDLIPEPHLVLSEGPLPALLARKEA